MISLEKVALYTILTGSENYNNSFLVSTSDYVGIITNYADKVLKTKPLSVTQKDKHPNFISQNDYFSIKKYWWPNPDTVDGLPYIRIDGKTNPECYSENYDNTRLAVFSEKLYVLTIAAVETRDKKYSDHALLFLNTWFVKSDTKQKPNFSFAQVTPGDKEGSFTGIIEARYLIYIIDSINKLEENGFLNEPIKENLKDWFSRLLDWMKDSPQGQRASKANNNIAIWYDLQCLVYADFICDQSTVDHILKNTALERINQQIEPDGSMPSELARANPLNYISFSLLAMAQIDLIGVKHGIHIWDNKTADGRGYQAVYDWLISVSQTQEIKTMSSLVLSQKENNFQNSCENQEANDFNALIAKFLSNESLQLKVIKDISERRREMIDVRDKRIKELEESLSADELKRLKKELKSLKEQLSEQEGKLNERANFYKSLYNEAREELRSLYKS